MSYKGTALQNMYHGSTPWDYHTLPILVSSYHTILYQLKSNMNCPPEPYATSSNHHWEEGYVRMPYSLRNLFPSRDDNGREIIVSRWELIKTTLNQEIMSIRDFEIAVNAYNTQLSTFYALHYLFEKVFDEHETKQFFTKLLPGIVKLAMKLDTILPGSIPILAADHCKSISMSQKQIACLLANAFLCTFPGRKAVTCPSINFNNLFSVLGKSECTLEKIKCLIHYFKRILDKMPCGVVTFERQHINRAHLPRWDKFDNNLGNVRVHIDSEGTIEDDGLGFLQVDFANKFIGGGVIGMGCVQEEIRFVICPELIVSRLFTDPLGNHEALIITGVERFSNYKGYGNTFEWDGNCIDTTPFDDHGRRRTTITAIDATHYPRAFEQFKCGSILRELNKAYVGFHSRATGSLTAVATGNWGCGAFGGNVHLKFLIQLMACSAARRDLVYFTFGSTALRDELYNMHTFLATNHVRGNELWRLLCQFQGKNLNSDHFFPFIQQAYFDSKKQPSISDAFSQLHSIARQHQLREKKAEQASTSKANEEKTKSDVTPSITNNNSMDWTTQHDESKISKEEHDEHSSPQVHKRKRNTSNSNSNVNQLTDISALISQIDGQQTSVVTETESSHNTSLGFLNCIDEYSKHQKAPQNSHTIEIDSPVEEMNVEEILETLVEQKVKNNLEIATPKRKITDYFKNH